MNYRTMSPSGFKSVGQSWAWVGGSTSFTKIIQGSGEAFTDVSVSDVNKAVWVPNTSQVFLETFENVNTERKRVIRPLKVRTVPIDQRIGDMTNVGYAGVSIVVNTVICKETDQAAKGLRSQNNWCFNCGKDLQQISE